MCSLTKDWKCSSDHMQQTYAAIKHIVKNIYFYNILAIVNSSDISPYDDGNITYKVVIYNINTNTCKKMLCSLPKHLYFL